MTGPIACFICGSTGVLHRFAPYGLVGAWACPPHVAELRQLPGEFQLALYDAPTAILSSSLYASRTSTDAADKAWRRVQRDTRAAMQQELRAASPGAHK